MNNEDKKYFENLWFKDSEHLMEEIPVQKLMKRVIELQEDVRSAEEGNTPLYCPHCSSCGEEGCCSPDNCAAVKCLYESSNLRSYRQAQMENSILWDFLEMIKLFRKNGMLQKMSLEEWAEETEEKINEMWSKEYSQLEKEFNIKNKIS